MMKKGISPLIATILIIGFTVALAAVIMTWGGAFIKGMQEETAKTAELKITCIQDIGLDIRNACIFGNKVEMLIENLGSESINSFIFRVKGSKGRVSEPSGNLGLGAAGISTFEAEFDPRLMGGIGRPTELDIFPRILSKDKSKLETCKETTVKIRPCEEPPSLSNKKDWTFNMTDQEGEKLNIGPFEEGIEKAGFGGIMKVEDFISMTKQTKNAEEKNLLDSAATILQMTAEEVEDKWLELTSPDVVFMMSNYEGVYKIILESAPFVIPEKANNLCYSSAWVLNEGGKVNFKLKFTDKTECGIEECVIEPVSKGNETQPSSYEKPSFLYQNCKLLSGEYPLPSLESDCGCDPKGKKASFIVEIEGKNQYEFALLTRFCYATNDEDSCIV